MISKQFIYRFNRSEMKQMGRNQQSNVQFSNHLFDTSFFFEQLDLISPQTFFSLSLSFNLDIYLAFLIFIEAILIISKILQSCLHLLLCFIKNLTMETYINLQQTPFEDMRFDKNKTETMEYSLYEKPQEEDSINYKIHSNFTKIDLKKFQLSNKADQKVFQDIIKVLQDELRLGYTILTSKKSKQIILKNSNTLTKYLNSQNPQVVAVLFMARQHIKQCLLPLEKILLIAQINEYPLLRLYCYLAPIQNPTKQIIQLKKQFQQYCLKTGMPEAFLFKGMSFLKNNQGKKAYEMLKNAQKLGFQPFAYKLIGQLFMGLTTDINCNYRVADKYLKKAKQSGVLMEPRFLGYISKIQNQKQMDRVRNNSIKSTQHTRSVQIANFIQNKMKQYQQRDFLRNTFKLSTTKNVTNPQSVSRLNDPKTFYVVFSPQMFLPGRHFLGRDIDGSIEFISIYNWDKIPIQKLKLLHQVGTKVVLNEYIRKIAADTLPLYRVDDPTTVQFYPRTQKHHISDKQFRNFAKNLFQRNILDKALSIYKYMIMKGCQEMEIVYSNIGLIYQNQNKVQEAVKAYENSLKIKPYQKSQVRLSNIYINKRQFEKAKKIINLISNVEEKQKLIKLMQELTQNESNAVNFNKIIKNKHQIKKLFRRNSELYPLLGNNDLNGMMNLREDRHNLLFHKNQFEEALGVNNLKQQPYLDLLQSIYSSVDSVVLTKQIVQKFLAMTSVTYKFRFKDKVYPFSSPYFAIVMPQLLNSKNLRYLHKDSQSVFYMSFRQNFLENRIQDLCLQLQKKGQYKDAELIYRFTGNYCAPFNVKVAQMMYNQQKYQQCLKYCQQVIVWMKKHPIQIFVKYINELTVEQLKCLIKLKKYQQTTKKGLEFIKYIQKANPKQAYEDYSFKNGIINLQEIKTFRQKNLTQVKNIKSVDPLLRDIYRQIVRGFIYLKDSKNAAQYLPKVLLKKEQSNYSEMIEQYYQGKILQLLVIKLQNSDKTIKQIDALHKQINKDKKLQNKLSYVKFLLKQKLDLLINCVKISQAIKQSEQIVKISEINLIFVKERLFLLIRKNPDKTLQILDKVKESNLLACFWEELCQRSKDFIQTQIAESKYQKSLTEISVSLQKIEIQSPLQDEDTQFKQQIGLQSEQSDVRDFQQQIASFQNQAEYQEEICRFLGTNGITYIVIFDQKLIQTLQKMEYRQFVCASDHFCRKQYGYSGIKIQADNLRLKIKSSSRLVGKLIHDKTNPKVKFCYFNKRQNHDDYKRK